MATFFLAVGETLLILAALETDLAMGGAKMGAANFCAPSEFIVDPAR